MKNTEENDTEKNTAVPKSLGFFEVMGQAFSLIFALQDRAGRKRLMELAETNPLPLLISGLTAMALFFLFCFISSQIVINYLVK